MSNKSGILIATLVAGGVTIASSGASARLGEQAHQDYLAIAEAAATCDDPAAKTLLREVYRSCEANEPQRTALDRALTKAGLCVAGAKAELTRFKLKAQSAKVLPEPLCDR